MSVLMYLSVVMIYMVKRRTVINEQEEVKHSFHNCIARYL